MCKIKFSIPMLSKQFFDSSSLKNLKGSRSKHKKYLQVRPKRVVESLYDFTNRLQKKLDPIDSQSKKDSACLSHL
jgi:hypothetical protein